MALTSPFNGLKMDRELACEFFALFSRFEFALKEEGHWRLNKFKRAVPDWERYKASLRDAALSPEAQAAMQFLLAEPPLVQVGAREWERVALHGDTPIAQALTAVSYVRNNLFHGGKYTSQSAPGRDEALVRASLVVLHACLEASPNLLATYNQHEF